MFDFGGSIRARDYLKTEPRDSKDWAGQAIVWARQQGIAESAFMTSHLLDLMYIEKARRHDPRYAIHWDWTDQELYEKLAGEIDDKGHRRFLPLSIEQFAGIAVRPLYRIFGADPSLNEKYGLKKPYPITPSKPEK